MRYSPPVDPPKGQSRRGQRCSTYRRSSIPMIESPRTTLNMHEVYHARSMSCTPLLLPSCHHFLPRSGGSASVGAGQPPSRPPPVERSASLGEEFHGRGLPGPDCHHQRRFSARHRPRRRERQSQHNETQQPDKTKTPRATCQILLSYHAFLLNSGAKGELTHAHVMATTWRGAYIPPPTSSPIVYRLGWRRLATTL